jgi:hypothetical protein
MEKVTFRTIFLSFLLSSTIAFSQTGYNYSGQVLYQNYNPMSGVTATLQTMEGDAISTSVTDYNGLYEFTDVPAGDYIVSFVTEEEAGGVEIDDAYLILQYLDEEIELTPIQELAADVNGNGVINMGDHNQIVNHYLNHGTPFPVGPWVFDNDTIVIPCESRDGGGFSMGSSSGDVNGSLQPDPKKNQIFLENPVMNLELSPEAALTFELSCPVRLELSGMHLAFRMPENLEIVAIESPVQHITYSVRDGILRITCLDNTRSIFEIMPGTPVVTVQTKEISGARSGRCSLVMCDESHFMDANGNLISGVKFELPVINFSFVQVLTHSAYPNPFVNTVNLDYEIETEGEIIIMIFDQNGRLVREVNEGALNAGIHQLKINGTDFAPGIYQYCITYSGINQQIETGKIIKTK